MRMNRAVMIMKCCKRGRSSSLQSVVQYGRGLALEGIVSASCIYRDGNILNKRTQQNLSPFVGNTLTLLAHFQASMLAKKSAASTKTIHHFQQIRAWKLHGLQQVYTMLGRLPQSWLW